MTSELEVEQVKNFLLDQLLAFYDQLDKVKVETPLDTLFQINHKLPNGALIDMVVTVRKPK